MSKAKQQAVTAPTKKTCFPDAGTPVKLRNGFSTEVLKSVKFAGEDMRELNLGL
jgi:hypothetical protein